MTRLPRFSGIFCIFCIFLAFAWAKSLAARFEFDGAEAFDFEFESLAGCNRKCLHDTAGNHDLTSGKRSSALDREIDDPRERAHRIIGNALFDAGFRRLQPRFQTIQILTGSNDDRGNFSAVRSAIWDRSPERLARLLPMLSATRPASSGRAG